jgi:hypothetical protein
MSTRRIKSTINNKYVQPLKLCVGRKLIITPNVDYNSILFTKKHKAKTKSDYNQMLWAKFETQNFDGIQLITYLEKDSEILAIGSCVFQVYSVSTDSNWSETLITTVNGTFNGNRLVASIPQSSLNPLELDGEITLAIKCTITRQDKTFTKKIYVNHLGVYDSIFRLRQDVEFLDITKVDE